MNCFSKLSKSSFHQENNTRVPQKMLVALQGMSHWPSVTAGASPALFTEQAAIHIAASGSHGQRPRLGYPLPGLHWGQVTSCPTWRLSV